MPSFRWSAINGGGDVVNGVMEAPDRTAVIDRLQRQGQIVLRADPADERRGLSEFLQLELGGARALDKTALGEFTRDPPTLLAPAHHLSPPLRFAPSKPPTPPPPP